MNRRIKHPLGHGKFEPIAGLLVGFTLMILGLITGFDQIKSIFQGHFVGIVKPIAWVIPLLALFLLEFVINP